MTTAPRTADPGKNLPAYVRRVHAALCLIVAMVGGSSLAFASNGLGWLQLDWDASYPGSVAPWAVIGWVMATLCFALTPSRPLIALLSYFFIALAVQGSEHAARCVVLDGVQDWAALLACVGVWLGKKHAPATGDRVGLVLFSLLVAYVIWSGVCLIYSWRDGPLPPPLYYRTPKLMLHCLVAMALTATCVHTARDFMTLATWLGAVLLWRIEMTMHSVHLEGHVASLVVMVVPLVGAAWLVAMREGLKPPLIAFSLVLLMAVARAVGLQFSVPASSNPQPWIPLVVVTTGTFVATVVGLSTYHRVGRQLSSAIGLLSLLGAMLYWLVAINNRAALLAAVAAFAVAWLLIGWRWKLATLVIAGLGAAALAPMIMRSEIADRFARIWNQQGQLTGSALGRVEIWQAGANMANANPVFGVGPGQFSNRVMHYSSDVTSDLDAHNSLIQVVGETGLPGGLLFIGLWITTLIMLVIGLVRSPSGSWERVATAGLLASLTAYAVVSVFGSRNDVPLAYVIPGMLLALRPRKPTDGQVTPPDPSPTT